MNIYVNMLESDLSEQTIVGKTSVILSIGLFVQVLLIPPAIDDVDTNWTKTFIPVWICAGITLLAVLMNASVILRGNGLRNYEGSLMVNSPVDTPVEVTIGTLIIVSCIVIGLPLSFFILLVGKLDGFVDVKWTTVFIPLYIILGIYVCISLSIFKNRQDIGTLL